MGTVSAFQSVTLDGIMQGVGRADEDSRGGFAHGGWGDGYSDEVAMQFVGEGMASTAGLLFGRRTYEDLLGYWTTTPDPNPFTEVLVNAPKWVASRSAGTSTAYPNTTLLVGDAVETVAALKPQVDGALTVMGSGELIRSLHAAGLVDEYILQIHPIVLGSGTRLFGEGARTDLTLTRTMTTTTGVMIAQYVVGKTVVGQAT